MSTVTRPGSALNLGPPQTIAIGDIVDDALMGLCGAATLSGFGMFFYQCYHWLRSGLWLPISVIHGIYMLKEKHIIDLTWMLRLLTDWQGIYKILDRTPASLFLLLTGMATMYLAARLEQAKKKPPANA
jgi:hypothetical protein